MKKKNLIKFYSETEHMIHCECCDGESVLTKEWYQALQEDNSIGYNRYLDCCKDSVGTVIDWCDYEDYMTPVKKGPYGIPVVKGYQFKN